MTELPKYAELPRTPEGAPSTWGLFGAEDNVGLINLLTPDRVAAGARLVRRGAMFRLDTPLDVVDVPFAPHRGQPRHTVIHAPGTLIFDDVVDNVYLQGTSQWDSLGHYGYMPDAFYNGATEADIAAGRRNTIEHWAAHGIAGRAVLLDIPRAWAAHGREFHPEEPIPLHVDDLEQAREFAGVELADGDILLLRTGYLPWYLGQSPTERRRLRSGYAHAGLAQDESVCEYLWDAHVVGVASDTPGTEMWPVDTSDMSRPFSFLHRILIGQFGMAIGELWDLEQLADDCAGDGVYEMFLVSAPLYIRGGIGSPPNVTAFK
jgi:kynurenine formamidase